MVTLAVLAALQHEQELAMHVKAALRNGLTPGQIQEVLLQVAVYAGVPAANRAFPIAQRALAEAASRGTAEDPEASEAAEESEPADARMDGSRSCRTPALRTRLVAVAIPFVRHANAVLMAAGQGLSLT